MENWVREQTEAVRFLTRLLSGREKIGPYPIDASFTHSNLYRDFVEDVEFVFKDGIGYDPAKLAASVRGLVGMR